MLLKTKYLTARASITGRCAGRIGSIFELLQGVKAEELISTEIRLSAAIVRRWENTPGKLNLQNRSQRALNTLAETASS